MLSSVLTAQDCAQCRFCCSFRRKSLWETPLFDINKLEEIKEKYPQAVFKSTGENKVTVDLDNNYTTDDSEEEALCYFNKSGCVLPPELKPFDCKIWPLRVMKKDEKLVIAFTPTCPVLGSTPSDNLKALVINKIGNEIFEYAHSHPEIVKEYREGFPVITEK